MHFVIGMLDFVCGVLTSTELLLGLDKSSHLGKLQINNFGLCIVCHQLSCNAAKKSNDICADYL